MYSAREQISKNTKCSYSLEQVKTILKLIKPILERSKVEEVRTLIHLMIEEITIDRKTRSVDTISIKFNRQLTEYLCLQEGASKQVSFFSDLKEEELEFVQLAVNQRDNFRIRENVSLPAGKPEIQEIIWDDVDVRNLNTRLADDGLKLAGDLDIFVMYIGNGETGNVQWYETTASFEGSLDISGCNADMIPYVNFQIIGKTVEERPDLDGENRDIAVEVVLDMDVKAYEERKKDVIADIYSPSYDMEIENADTQLRCLVVRNNVSSRVSGNLQLENYADLMQICNCTATVQLDDVTYKEGELVAEGVVSANVFYITSSDSQPLGSVHTIIPFAGTVKIDGVSPDSLEYNIKPSVQQLSATINSAGVIEVKSSVSLDVIVFRNFEYSGIKSAYMSEEKCNLSKMPSMTGYIADGTKTLWDVSKMYHTTADSIKASNPKCADGLSESVIIPRGTKLLLVKA